MTRPTIYSADTSFFIQGWKYFPPELLDFWDRIDGLIQEDRFYMVEHAMLELEYQKDDAYAWARQRDGLVVRPTEALSEAMFPIMASHPKLIADGRRRHAADPWVVALALQLGAVVVTEEFEGRKGEVKIPDVCEYWGVECVNLQGLARREGWRFLSAR